ncbi:hypothetical protein NDN08_005357 [Rhodosorus marinus]|uniref:EGF-like domain-containing protein n=1 Tax=Rhodosorus marinus TaxID=101924 RepID=A0AAV8V4N5_9RHOD|nr:hypothetical protein NDN08_005357 [Rhodosorus marinus]
MRSVGFAIVMITITLAASSYALKNGGWGDYDPEPEPGNPTPTPKLGCAGNPCRNGSSCYNRGSGEYTCHCRLGWYGTRCTKPWGRLTVRAVKHDGKLEDLDGFKIPVEFGDYSDLYVQVIGTQYNGYKRTLRTQTWDNYMGYGNLNGDRTLAFGNGYWTSVDVYLVDRDDGLIFERNDEQIARRVYSLNTQARGPNSGGYRQFTIDTAHGKMVMEYEYKA